MGRSLISRSWSGSLRPLSRTPSILLLQRLHGATMLFWLLLVGVVGAWPSGAPSKACDSMMPQHGANRPQSARSVPYTLVQSTDSYRPGDQVIVYVRGTLPFKGLLIQAFDPRTNSTLGEFVEGAGLKKLGECASMSHADNRDKKAATLVWLAPPNSNGNVRFRGTVVQQFNTFYHGLSATVQKV